ncbi:MAG: DUF2334 domain-containing protein [Halobacteriota archaeon]
MTRRTTIFSALLVVLVLLCAAPVTAQTSVKQKYVIFRDDDLGLGHQTDTLKALNQVHIDEAVPVTLAIVPHPYGGEPHREAYANASNELLSTNPEFLGYMRSISSDPLFEFAQHGYAHVRNNFSTRSYDTGEFARKPYQVQYDSIRKGRDDIKEAFGITPTTFIPPWDRGDTNTLAALRELGFTEYCSGGTDMKTLYGSVDRIRVEADSFDIDGSSYAELNSSINTARDRIDQFSSDPYTDTYVVGYHFWTFNGVANGADLTKVQLLRDFVKYVRNHGNISFTRLDRSVAVPNHVTLTVAENEVAAPSSQPIVRDQSENVSSAAVNVAIGAVPLYALPALVVGIVLVGPYLYARRRGGDTVARFIAASPAPSEQHTVAEDNINAAPAQLSRCDQEALHKYGVVSPTGVLSEPLGPSEQRAANDHTKPSASDSLDE